jgi:thioredoxin-related protein
MAMRPVVDGIEREWQGRLKVIRLDIQNATGRALSRDLAAVYTPTFILYDAQGQELLRRVGSLTPDDIQQALFLR